MVAKIFFNTASQTKNSALKPIDLHHSEGSKTTENDDLQKDFKGRQPLFAHLHTIANSNIHWMDTLKKQLHHPQLPIMKTHLRARVPIILPPSSARKATNQALWWVAMLNKDGHESFYSKSPHSTSSQNFDLRPSPTWYLLWNKNHSTLL